MSERKRIKVFIGRYLRRWADMLDPPTVADPLSRKSPHHFAVANPVILKSMPDAVGQAHTGLGNNRHLGHGQLPGRWGGPYV
jgi:hypothetical protein